MYWLLKNVVAFQVRLNELEAGFRAEKGRMEEQCNLLRVESGKQADLLWTEREKIRKLQDDFAEVDSTLHSL